MDNLSQLPVGPVEEDEVVSLTTLPDFVQTELREINEDIQNETPVCQRLVSMNGYSFDKQRRIVVGPAVSHHLMGLLHKTSAGHLGSWKLLVKFWE